MERAERRGDLAPANWTFELVPSVASTRPHYRSRLCYHLSINHLHAAWWGMCRSRTQNIPACGGCASRSSLLSVSWSAATKTSTGRGRSQWTPQSRYPPVPLVSVCFSLAAPETPGCVHGRKLNTRGAAIKKKRKKEGAQR